ncbi:MAG: glycosyltransferase [Desulfobacteraceae bacterium]|nr:glycosyltransferase [Desulfobacteraceae bacterium]
MENFSSEQSTVDISIVVCTYNRAEMLEDTLRSWVTVDKESIHVELVVVDNNSTDLTRQVVRQFEQARPGEVIYVFEDKPGLSFARNKGIEIARGRLIAFVDDDIYFTEDWLKEILNTFRNQGRADCVGGNSIPSFEIPKPEWLTDDLMRVYGSTLSGETEKVMAFPEHPFGVNMVFKREVFERIGLFNTRLGRIKKSLLSNEEKELFYRIDQAGLLTYYSPKAIIFHRIPADRIDQRWILRRMYWQGISKVSFSQIIDKKSRFYLLKDTLRNFKNFLFGQRPYSVRNCIVFFPWQAFKVKLRAVLSFGITIQSLIEIFNHRDLKINQ